MKSYWESDDEDVVRSSGRQSTRGRAQKRRKTGTGSSDEDEFKQDDEADDYFDDG